MLSKFASWFPSILIACTLACIYGDASGAAPRLGLPLQCVPGKNCWIVNHVDTDPGSGASDYACGHMTYNGHEGTDFAIRDAKAMENGVPVVAAAAGVVQAVRDGEPDVNVRARAATELKGRECGNAVRIRHSDEWETLYCHLRRGSVSVKRGDAVAAGTAIGLVGLSGQTEFPHVHLAVRFQRRIVDPFRGIEGAAQCALGSAPLWEPATLATLRYTRGALYNFGAAPETADPERARSGAYRDGGIPANAAVLSIWAEAWGAKPGDVVLLELHGPDGNRVISRRAVTNANRVRVFFSAGRRKGAEPWPAGEYRGKITYSGSAGIELSAAQFVAVVRDANAPAK